MTASNLLWAWLVLALGLCPADAALAQAQTSTAAYRVETVTDQLGSPAQLVFLPDGRLLVAERGGALRLIDAQGRLRPEPVAGTPNQGLDDTTGLIDIALEPDFASTQRVFLSYQHGTKRANQTRLASARLQGDRLTDLKTLFDALPAKSGTSNFGGRIVFLADKTIVFSVGDGFDTREQAQNPRSHLGKLVRLNRDGSVPANNPFVGRQDAAPEVYSLGHRNLQGLAFDAATQRLFANEHGAKGGDEINLIEPGRNYGWPLATFGVDYTGARITPFTALPGLTPPLLHWTPSIAPSALAIYRGQPFKQWDGDLLSAALVAKAVYRVRLDGNRVVQQEKLFAELDARIRSVNVGPDGFIYLLTDDKTGRLLRVVPRP